MRLLGEEEKDTNKITACCVFTAPCFASWKEGDSADIDS